MRATVVGGSISGLTAALLLRDEGRDVHVHERSPAALQSRGAGIVVHPTTARYIVDRGLAQLDEVSTAANRLVYVDRDGEVVFAQESPYQFTAWNTLYRTLRGHLEEDRYPLGEAMSDFEQDEDGVEVRFATGRTERCELLVCADGTSSTARPQLLPQVQPTYSGYVGWRGTVPEARVSAATRLALGSSLLYHVMPNSHILGYPIPAPGGSAGTLRAWGEDVVCGLAAWEPDQIAQDTSLRCGLRGPQD